MYYFNYKLLEALPGILGITQKDMLAELGTTAATYIRWKEKGMPCRTLADLCNTFRISVASFLVLKESPVLYRRASDYVFPDKEWKPVTWDGKVIGTLFGPEGLTGIGKSEASRRIGFANYQIFDQWAKSKSGPQVHDMLKVLNEFRLDASLFFGDANQPIPIPDWSEMEKHTADLLKERLGNYREMERTITEKNRIIHSLHGEKDRLVREITLLKAAKKASAGSAKGGMLKEGSPVYGHPLGERGYVFHKELWDELPRLTGMTLKDYCAAIGLPYSSFYTITNLSVTMLVNVCNLFRISVSHFFLPKSEVPVVHDLGYYTMSPSLFVPIESRMENLRYLFGRYGVTGFSLDDLDRQGTSFESYASMARNGYTARVNTLCGICTSFNIPPYIFFKDENRRKAAYSESLNERLLLNAMEISRENESLKKRIKRLEEKLKKD